MMTKISGSSDKHLVGGLEAFKLRMKEENKKERKKGDAMRIVNFKFTGHRTLNTWKDELLNLQIS